MDDQLVGYLLDALEPDQERSIELYLRENPEARHKLDLLRQAVEPLAADRDEIDPPRALWVRTLARIAEQSCRDLPRAPARLGRSGGSGGWWRRADVAAAAGILLCLGLLIPPALGQLRSRSDLAVCQNNLRLVYQALTHYSDQHDGNLPDVASAAPAPKNIGAIFAPVLVQNGLLPTGLPRCPTSDASPVARLTLDEVKQMPNDQFRQTAASLAGGYAYSLGYVDGAGVHGLRLRPTDEQVAYVAVLADGPPPDAGAGNSLNHGGRGQNVVYLDGHLGFFTERTVGADGDDIYLNYVREVAAGKSRLDTVLAAEYTP